MPEHLTRDAFAENLNTAFRLQHPEMGSIELQLIHVSELKTSPRQSIYSLILRGPLDHLFQQGLYPMEHATLGAFQLFLVPVTKAADEIHYQAVFNQLVNW